MTPHIITWPTSWWGRALTTRFHLRSASQISAATWTQSRNVYGPHSEVWVAQVMMQSMKASEWRVRAALLSELDGPNGLLRIGDSMRCRPGFDMQVGGESEPWSDGTFFSDGTGWAEGYLPPSVFVSAAAARGASAVEIGGLPASTRRVLRRGDLFEIRRNGIADETPSLHEIIRDASTDAAGRTLLQIRPRLRKGVDVGDQVVLRFPTSVFRLLDNEAAIDRDPTARGTAGLTLIEHVI